MSDDNDVKYSPFASSVDPSFWHKLSQIKLDVDRLEENIHPIWGSYSNVNSVGASLLNVSCTSYNSDFESLLHLLPASGFHLNKNTVESFKDCDKSQLLEEQGLQLWRDVTSGAVLKNPALLSRFFLLTFGDLKKYQFYYWFAFLAPSSPVVKLQKSSIPLSTHFTPSQIESLESEYSNILDVNQRGYFIVRLEGEGNSPKIILLAEICNVYDGKDLERIYLAFADPCPSGDHPGWPLRNLINVLLHYCPHMSGKDINVLCLRLRSQSQAKLSASERSLVLTVQAQQSEQSSSAKWIGWERNTRGNFGPRSVNLSANMDPTRLAESAVHLNLKLMKWRLLPQLDLEGIHKTHCLLMGAGTLGCTVARTLMGWGVQHITFVDNGKVSYSNPVRQSLFTFEDCLDGGKPKAVAAAEALKRIYPGVNSSGVQVNIPMPGHTVGESLMQETRDAVDTLEKLVDNHDVVFMLTDSRESRWLPTLLAASKKKLALNAALGFDSYLVMRHGIHIDNDSSPNYNANHVPGRHLGCYFCNDVTAPGNSMADRTLDQQCTVTRPGVSAMAGALVVELMVSILQHPLRGDAHAYSGRIKNSGAEGDADGSEAEESEPSLLGLVPHSVRGFLATWEQLQPATHRFNSCIACSGKVLNEYSTRGFDFILDALNSSSYLEDLSGLTEMHKETECADVWALSDSGEDGSDQE